MFRLESRYLHFVVLAIVLLSTFAAFAAQNDNAASGPATISIPEHGVTVQIPPGWSHRKDSNAHEILNLPANRMSRLTDQDLDETSRMTVSKVKRSSHAAALVRLQQIANEQNAPSTFMTIDGWPALQRVATIKKPTEGDIQDQDGAEMQLYVTTAVAVGNDVVRIDAFIPANVPAAKELANQAKSVGTSMKFSRSANAASTAKDLQQLQTAPPLTQSVPTAGSGTSTATSSLQQQLAGSDAGLAVNLQLGSEPEIAVSTNGQNIVVAAGSTYRSSKDGGVTFPYSNNFGNSTGGDSSLAYGRTGRFYEATIGSSTCTPKCNNDSQFMNVSTDGGQTFTSLGAYFQCSGNCAFGGVPDQEHIAADRYNFGTGAADQVYSVWRRPAGYMITCSSDSGQNWTTASYRTGGSVDFGRITVGQDGSVYVVVLNGNNVELDKYNSCVSGFANVFQGNLVGTANPVVCPVTGLDRCNNGNDLRSATVAVDDTNASHVYVAVATNTAAGNENVMMFDSLDGGNNFGGTGRSVQVNNGVLGRRYMPWVCSVGGSAYVSWYDRRNSFTPAGVDLTDYYTGVVGRDALGNLAVLSEFQVNAPGTSDPNCTPGWPCGARSANDSLACTGTQLDGFCQHSPSTATDSNVRCSLNGGTCADPAETCTPGGGCPKYGDYNGNACAAGRVYNIWATATAQPSPATAPAGINLFYSAKLVCCTGQIQAPKTLSLNACTGASDTTTLNVCNTGKDDLRIDSIVSSTARFTVPAPSSSYPVVISHDACIPFTVNYTPNLPGSTDNATLTINSNDSVNPSATVTLTGTSGEPKIATSIVNSGNFGDVCGGSQSNLSINVVNQGTCDLTISNITSNSANFLAPTFTKPVTLSHDASTSFPITYKPADTCSDTVANTGIFTITSNTIPSTSTVAVTGKEPCPHLNFNPTALTGINAFPPTVSDPLNNLGCFSDKQVTLSNSGACSLTIANVSTGNPAFKIINPTSFPLTIAPGGGTQKVTVRFKPTSLAGQINNAPDSITDTLTITSNDPNAAGTAAVCGEPVVKSGIRLLVTNTSNVPFTSVDQIDLSSFGLQPSFGQTLKPALLQTGAACGNTLQYDLDNESLVPAGTTGSNPKASYTVRAKIGASQTSQSFTLGQCEFKQMVLQVGSKK